MLVKCVSVEYISGAKYNVITPGKAPGYEIAFESSKLDLIFVINNKAISISIKEFFMEKLNAVGRKKLTPKVRAAIEHAMPQTLNVNTTGCPITPYNIELIDLNKWWNRALRLL